METRNARSPESNRIEQPAKANLVLRVSIVSFLFTVGCGAPGEPTPPAPLVPVPVVDLAVTQIGDGAQLVFTLPAKAINGDKLAEAPAVEIHRGSPKPDGTSDEKSFRVIYTIPGSLLDTYLSNGRVHFTDAVAPEELQAHPELTFLYRVRTRASRKRASADSNTVAVRIFAVPERINVLEARVTETAIELSWTAPSHTSAGDPLSRVNGYHVYRGEIDPASTEAAAKDPGQAKWLSPLTQIASTSDPSYRDTSFEFGKTYFYIVRSVIPEDDISIESGDSGPAAVTPRDIFPPAAPQELVAAVLPGTSPGSLVVDLSWSINLETDLGGYRVYRSEQQDVRGPLLTSDLLATPAYRDTSVVSGHRYWYSVTAVDRSGNESQPSVPADTGVTQPPQ